MIAEIELGTKNVACCLWFDPAVSFLVIWFYQYLCVWGGGTDAVGRLWLSMNNGFMIVFPVKYGFVDWTLLMNHVVNYWSGWESTNGITRWSKPCPCVGIVYTGIPAIVASNLLPMKYDKKNPFNKQAGCKVMLCKVWLIWFIFVPKYQVIFTFKLSDDIVK